jgi:predicted nucleotidyltransferase
MEITGIVCEYNPLHIGHARMLRQLRERGTDAIVCAMSGNFVQRGEAAVADKSARAEMALRCGADLVLEIPTPWATATAETFARGGVGVLRRTGVVTSLAFGAEDADVEALQHVADALDSEAYRSALKTVPEDGATFAVRRQKAVAAVLGEEPAGLLSRPNNILAVEYIRALRGTGIRPVAIQRQGADHDAEGPEQDTVSAAYLRRLLKEERAEEALGYMPEAAARILEREILSGKAPADLLSCDRAILDRLRRMKEAEWARYDRGGEGLYHRLFQAAREAVSVADLLERAKTKRYPMARLRRMVLAAWLETDEIPEEIPYLRLLAASDTGRKLLRQMGEAPVLTKAADVAKLGGPAEELFRRESRWSDLYALACPTVQPCGADWRITPVLTGAEKEENSEKTAYSAVSAGSDPADGLLRSRSGLSPGARGPGGSADR